MQPGEAFEVAYTKWGGQPHWRFVGEVIGEDEHGVWAGGRPGITIQRGLEEPRTEPHGFVMLVPRAGEWTAFWNAAGDFRVYVDVCREVRLVEGGVRAVDMDLDVVRLGDGSVEVLDEDEFAEHQVKYGYNREAITDARETCGWLVEAVKGRLGPFGAAGDERLRAFASLWAAPK